MKRFLALLFCVCVMVIGLTVNLHAAEKISKIDKRTEQFLETMDEQQKKQFADIRMGHGVVRAVEHTNASIDRAVKSCMKHNPSLKPEFTSIHKEWKAGLLPTLRKGEERVDQMIKRQRIAKPLVIRSYLKEYDQAAMKKNKKIKETPITSIEECQKLMGKMKSVEGELVSLIVDTLKLNQEF